MGRPGAHDLKKNKHRGPPNPLHQGCRDGGPCPRGREPAAGAHVRLWLSVCARANSGEELARFPPGSPAAVRAVAPGGEDHPSGGVVG